MQRAEKSRVKLCILAVALASMCSAGLSASVAEIAAFFPEYNVQVIQTGVNTISLVAVVSSLISGWLAYRHSKKVLILLGFIIVGISGIAGFFFHDTLFLFYLWSMAIGFGVGFFSPSVMSLVIDYFEGEERNHLAGLQTSFINGGGVILTFAGGLLATIAWNFSYLVYLGVIPVIIICALFLPAKNRFVAEKHEKLKIPGCVNYYLLTTFLQALVYNVFPMNIALFLSEKGLGDASMAGIVNAVFMVGGVVMGLIFSKLSSYMYDHLFGVSHVVLVISFLIICNTDSLVLVFIAAFIGGTSISMTMPQCIYSVSAKIPPVIAPAILSLALSVSPSIAYFVSPASMAFLSGLISDTGDSVSRFFVAGILSLIFAILQFVIVSRSRIVK